VAPPAAILYSHWRTAIDRLEMVHAQHQGFDSVSSFLGRSTMPARLRRLPAPLPRMTETRFWLIRHALVDENARAILYGIMDVALCEPTLLEQGPMYESLARRLPREAPWLVTPLSRTRRTAEAIFVAGYPRTDLTVEPGLIEQSLGEWQGLAHADLPERLTLPKHAFWPLAGREKPPGGESMADVISRVGVTMDRLAEAHDGQDVIAVAHGGSIRAAVAHALCIGPDSALHLSVQNLSLTRLERFPDGWRVVCVNELPGY
jgi:alpha-ribazole phosphatase